MHLTDPHLFGIADGELRGTVTEASLQQVLDHYDAGGWRAERALVTGDLIQDDSKEAYDRFRELMLPLNMRMHCIPGNHDVREFMRNICVRPPFSYCATEEIHNWLLVGLDSCISGDAGGHIEEQEFERLERIVSSSSAQHVLVFLHHPPVMMGSAWLDTVGLRNGDDFLERLAAMGRIRLVVFGHVHQPYDAEHNGIRIVGTPSTCSQFKPGSDDFALDGRPPAYRRIILNKDGSTENELIWVGT